MPCLSPAVSAATDSKITRGPLPLAFRSWGKQNRPPLLLSVPHADCLRLLFSSGRLDLQPVFSPPSTVWHFDTACPVGTHKAAWPDTSRSDDGHQAYVKVCACVWEQERNGREQALCVCFCVTSIILFVWHAKGWKFHLLLVPLQASCLFCCWWLCRLIYRFDPECLKPFHTHCVAHWNKARLKKTNLFTLWECHEQCENEYDGV